ncbi:hypothetical protein H5410_013951 [Solanum commersonii]|uniref:Uncharacterized protein n=1 Tax=Solanum commersonii TaxID=4109 RepID=A0A9J5ZQ07_SOLCO|nr:hypothetical protein H5410_013951 [Solanum commersonii]
MEKSYATQINFNLFYFFRRVGNVNKFELRESHVTFIGFLSSVEEENKVELRSLYSLIKPGCYAKIVDLQAILHSHTPLMNSTEIFRKKKGRDIISTQ